MEVDVRRDEPPQRRRTDSRRESARRPRALRIREERLDLRGQRGSLPCVRAAGVRGGSHGAGPEGVFDGPAPLLEPLAVEEPGLVQAFDELADLLRRRGLAVALLKDSLDLADRVLAVEERDEVEQRKREHDDLISEARGIPERHQPLAVLLDGEGLEHPKSRPVVHQGPLRGLGRGLRPHVCCRVARLRDS